MNGLTREGSNTPAAYVDFDEKLMDIGSGELGYMIAALKCDEKYVPGEAELATLPYSVADLEIQRNILEIWYHISYRITEELVGLLSESVVFEVVKAALSDELQFGSKSIEHGLLIMINGIRLSHDFLLKAMSTGALMIVFSFRHCDLVLMKHRISIFAACVNQKFVDEGCKIQLLVLTGLRASVQCGDCMNTGYALKAIAKAATWSSAVCSVADASFIRWLCSYAEGDFCMKWRNTAIEILVSLLIMDDSYIDIYKENDVLGCVIRLISSGCLDLICDGLMHFLVEWFVRFAGDVEPIVECLTSIDILTLRYSDALAFVKLMLFLDRTGEVDILLRLLESSHVGDMIPVIDADTPELVELKRIYTERFSDLPI